jgi:hypothetical protein
VTDRAGKRAEDLAEDDFQVAKTDKSRKSHFSNIFKQAPH